jgi:hypothetical protein
MSSYTHITHATYSQPMHVVRRTGCAHAPHAGERERGSFTSPASNPVRHTHTDTFLTPPSPQRSRPGSYAALSPPEFQLNVERRSKKLHSAAENDDDSSTRMDTSPDAPSLSPLLPSSSSSSSSSSSASGSSTTPRECGVSSHPTPELPSASSHPHGLGLPAAALFPAREASKASLLPTVAWTLGGSGWSAKAPGGKPAGLSVSMQGMPPMEYKPKLAPCAVSKDLFSVKPAPASSSNTDLSKDDASDSAGPPPPPPAAAAAAPCTMTGVTVASTTVPENNRFKYIPAPIMMLLDKVKGL